MATKVKSEQLRQSGWETIPATLSYSSADDPTYVVGTSVDLTTLLSVGMRLRVSQTTGGTKYFIITAINATTITLYGGTDYDMNNEAISSPCYSVHKAPFGFPLSPIKWTISANKTAQTDQSSPTANTWYNLATFSLAIPIGAWDVDYQATLNCYHPSSQYTDFVATLSTTNNSETDTEFTSFYNIGPNVGGSLNVDSTGFVTRQKHLVLAAKTTYYFNAKTTTNGTVLALRADRAKSIIKAVCAYL